MFRMFFLLIALALLLPTCSIGPAQSVEPALKPVAILEQGDVRISAHRGSSAKTPENTKISVLQAIADGAGYAEIDVQETADGVVVLLHDYTFLRTAGVNKAIWDMTYEEVLGLDAGVWFGVRFRGERVPTLAEVMEITRGRIKLNIEIKNNKRDQKLPERVAEEIRSRKMESECIVTSFDEGMLKRFRAVGIGVKTGLIVGNKMTMDGYRFAEQPHELISVKAALLSEQIMLEAAVHDIKVMAWTVNDLALIRKMLDLNVYSVITDYPDRVRAELEARAARHEELKEHLHSELSGRL
jgi:glycerophosphoryl diester phosphodiesterase